MQEITTNSAAETASAAAGILQAHGHCRVFAFTGRMGAGKTTLIKAMCRSLGIIERTGSPSFSIINEYLDEAGRPVYHFDFFRISNFAEAVDTGCEDYFLSGNYCFIEWPDIIKDLLPAETVFVEISDGEKDESRVIRF